MAELLCLFIWLGCIFAMYQLDKSAHKHIYENKVKEKNYQKGESN